MIIAQFGTAVKGLLAATHVHLIRHIWATEFIEGTGHWRISCTKQV